MNALDQLFHLLLVFDLEEHGGTMGKKQKARNPCHAAERWRTLALTSNAFYVPTIKDSQRVLQMISGIYASS